jgi:hypothetical protein
MVANAKTIAEQKEYHKFGAGNLVRYTCPSKKYHGIHVFNKSEWNENSFGLLLNNLTFNEIKFFSKSHIGMVIEEKPKHRKNGSWRFNGSNAYYRVLIDTELYWIHHSHLTFVG